jgi:hypothetical protein
MRATKAPLLDIFERVPNQGIFVFPFRFPAAAAEQENEKGKTKATVSVWKRAREAAKQLCSKNVNYKRDMFSR